jgi:hypothetical protein
MKSFSKAANHTPATPRAWVYVDGDLHLDAPIIAALK